MLHDQLITLLKALIHLINKETAVNCEDFVTKPIAVNRAQILKSPLQSSELQESTLATPDFSRRR